MHTVPVLVPGTVPGTVYNIYLKYYIYMNVSGYVKCTRYEGN